MFVSKFAVPEIIFGTDSIMHIASCARRLGAHKVFLVSDTGLEKAGWVSRIMDILRDDGLKIVYFNEVNQNPRDWQVHRGASIYLAEDADVIIGLGGGSAIDAAKGIAVVAGNSGLIRDYEGANRIMRPLPPMIFVPTTAGSGSDISQFCIITDVERQVKMSIISRSLVPNVSIIDPSILTTKSRELIVLSAVDALAHAVESFVSRLASPFTEQQALGALTLIPANIHRAVDDRDPHALEKLSIASTAAGMSFSNAGLGVCHALAHTIGGRYDVAHGKLHPVLLPAVMRYNAEACPDRLLRICGTLDGCCGLSDEATIQKGIGKLENLFQELGASARLRDLMPDGSCLEEICRLAVHDACALTNPRDADWKDLMSICEEVW